MTELLDDERRRILTLVAEGSLAPADAADLLAAIDAKGLDNPVVSEDRGSRTSHVDAGDGPARRIKVIAVARRVEIVGDRTVHEAVADGDHVARREGSTLVIDGTPSPSDHESHEFRFHRRGTVIIGGAKGLKVLQVRVRPDLDVELEVQAGSVTVDGVVGAIKATVAAGSARIDDFHGPLEIDVAAGSFKGSGRLAHGASHVRCQAGSVHLILDETSDVTIKGRVDLGRMNVPKKIGAGRASLDIEASLGSVTVVEG